MLPLGPIAPWFAWAFHVLLGMTLAGGAWAQGITGGDGRLLAASQELGLQMTPLCWAALSGDTKTVRNLLSKGADLGARSLQGDTALSCALIEWVGVPKEDRRTNERRRERKAQAFFLILEGRPDPNAATVRGITALHRLATSHFSEQSTLKIAAALLKRGADRDARDHNGMTALMYAQERNMQSLVTFLTDRTGRARAQGR